MIIAESFYWSTSEKTDLLGLSAGVMYSSRSLLSEHGHFATINQSQYILQYLTTILLLCPEGDANGFRNSVSYDANGRKQASISPLNFRVTNVYNNASQMIATQDALGNLHTVVRDANGAAIASVSPLGFRISTVLSATGQALATIDSLGNRNSNVFDLAG